MGRRTIVWVMLGLVACVGDQPTEPTYEQAPFQAALAPPPAPPTVLSGTLDGAEGGPVHVDLGDYESPVYSKVTVSGLLSYQGAGGYLPGTGQIDAAGVVIQNQCDLFVAVRAATGIIGGANTCPSQPRQIDSYVKYSTVNGHVDAYRTTGPPGSCWKYNPPCIHISGTQTITVEPQEGEIVLTVNKTTATPGGGIYVFAKGVLASNLATSVPMAVREWRWEGVGPEVGGGHTKVCAAYYPNQCIVQVYQSGRVVLEALVNGKVKTASVEIAVIGGDTLPLPPPPDTLPHEPPGDTGGTGGGGGGGGGGGCPGGCCGEPMPGGAQLTDCNPAEPPSVEITEISTTYGDNSFMAWQLAEPVKFKAKVLPAGNTETVHWAITDDPTDEVVSAKPFKAPIASGTDVSFRVPAPEAPAPPDETGASRWYQYRDEEPGTLAHKSLAVRVRAYIAPAGSDTVWSEPFTLRQVAVDALRQEYVDLAQPLVPARAWVTSPTGSAWFSLAALAGTSDYVGYPASLAWLTSDLKQGLDVMQDVGFWLNLDLVLNSGYRNPVHNWMHVHLNQRYTSDKHSRHQFGAAADVNAAHDEDLFYEISEIGAALGACMEPPEDWLVAKYGRPARGAFVHDWTHVHVEFNPLTPCPDRMSRWSESLVY